MEHKVAPLVGAWIEMVPCTFRDNQYQSLPLWERGLKYPFYALIFLVVQSLPLWERGLKFMLPFQAYASGEVAPLVGAWIEIYDGWGSDF